MSRRPRFSFGFFVPMLAALLLVIAVSCGGAATSTSVPQPVATSVSAEPTAVPTAVPTAAPVTAVEQSGHLNIAFKEMGIYTGNPSMTVAPANGYVTLATYENLLRRDVNGKYFGLLADSWTIGDDNLTWTFNLKKGVQFHDDVGEVTAEDVVWSILELGREGSTAAAIGQTRRIFGRTAAEQTGEFEGHFKALDDYTIELKTEKPYFDVMVWINTPTTNGGWVVSKKQWEELSASIGADEANFRLAGTGPWEMVENETAAFWRFKARKEHHNKAPFFADMTFFEIPEESTRIANFQTGRIDTFAPAPDSLQAMAAVPDVQFMSQKGASESTLNIYGGWYWTGIEENCPDIAKICPAPGWDPDAPYVSSNPDPDSPEWERARKVREALSIAIDRQKIVDELLGGEGGPLVMWGWGTFPDRYLPEWKWEYNVEKAKQLLKEAGYEDGFEVNLIPSIRGAPAEAEACEAVGDMWLDIGVKANFQRIPYSTFSPQQRARTYQGFACHAVDPQEEPLVVLGFTFSPAGGYSSGLDHPYLTPRIDTAQDTFDVDERWKLQTEIASWLWDNTLALGLYFSNLVYALGPKVVSWEQHLSTGDPRRISGLEWADHR